MVKVWVGPPPDVSRAMGRVASALARTAPREVEMVPTPGPADLVFVHAIDWEGTVEALRQAAARDQRAVVIQYCLRTTSRPSVADWVPLWRQVELVWSYYDLPAMAREDGASLDGVAAHVAPLGVDRRVFGMADRPRPYTVLTTGWVPETEGVLEVAEAVARVGGQMWHIGPRETRFGGYVRQAADISDRHLADLLNQCQWSVGLRRVEGFELPAAEGLLCGARPILFDRDHYRRWFGRWGVFVPELPPPQLVERLVELFRDGPEPVTQDERREAAAQFDWDRICGGVWQALGLGPRRRRAPTRRRLLWVGDAAVASGFAVATHGTLRTLARDWDVHVLGINYDGDPHEWPYPIYPASKAGAFGGDLFGLSRTAELVTRLRPDVVVVQNDPWNVPPYVEKCGGVPVVASMPVDGLNCRGRALNGLAHAVFWTEWALHEARRGGYVGEASVIPLGVDRDVFSPIDKRVARSQIGLPRFLEDAWIVGTVNRNQPRKRFDLLILYVAEWIKSRGVDDAYLFVHAAPTGEASCDIRQLAEYVGLQGRLILSEPEFLRGLSTPEMVATYASCDVYATTTQGEGWGLPAMEAMACGTPVVAPEWAALGEWAKPAAVLVPCSGVIATPSGINAIGGLVDREAFIRALDLLYRDREVWRRHRQAGLDLVAEPRFRWEEIGRRFGEVLERVVYGATMPVGVAAVGAS